MRDVRATNGGGLRVLLVEDHAESAASIARLLTLFGYDVRVEYDGPAAIRLASSFAPEAALIDLTLPSMDGCVVAERLRALPETRHALLIAMTGWTTDDHAQRTRAAGFDLHLVKPLSVETLVGALTVHA
jgi:CheY-like chemotaxis protein